MKLMTAAGAALLIIGIILGVTPGHASGALGMDSPISCGSPWFRDHTGEQHAAAVDNLATSMEGGGPAAGNRYRIACDDATGTRGVFAWVLAGLGLLTLIGLGLIAAQRRSGGTPTATT
jgi:hypothetical protein